MFTKLFEIIINITNLKILQRFKLQISIIIQVHGTTEVYKYHPRSEFQLRSRKSDLGLSRRKIRDLRCNSEVRSRTSWMKIRNPICNSDFALLLITIRKSDFCDENSSSEIKHPQIPLPYCV